MKICSVPECNNKHFSNGFCSRHYQQIHKYGKIMSTNSRTQKDPNEFIIDGDICWIILYNNKCEEISRTKFNLHHYETIKNFKWSLNSKGYPVTTWIDENGKHQGTLHQAVIQLLGITVPDDYEIDHKDQNPLNNLDENLRVCTFSQNQQNVKLQKRNKSGLKGINWNKRTKKWQVQITISKKYKYLGSFKNKKDAIKTYNKAAILYYGEFAVLNNI